VRLIVTLWVAISMTRIAICSWSWLRLRRVLNRRTMVILLDRRLEADQERGKTESPLTVSERNVSLA
jgi:hypothetical protein